MADQKISEATGGEISVPALDDFTVWVDNGSTTRYRISGSRLGGLLSPLYTTSRLTLVTGNAVPLTDQLAKGTLYYTSLTNDGTLTSNPFQIVIFDGTRLRLYSSAEISLALTLTSGKNYDVFIYDNAGTLTLELSAAWTNDTTRADALAAQSGQIVKSGATSRRWIGAIRASATNQTEDSRGGTTTNVGGKRFVWNAYNQMPRIASVIDTSANWAYATATIRQARGQAGNKVEYVTGSAVSEISATSMGGAYAYASATIGGQGVGIDSTTAFAGRLGMIFVAATGATGAIQSGLHGLYRGSPGLGYHYVSLNEVGPGGTCLFVGLDSATGLQAGLDAVLLG